MGTGNFQLSGFLPYRIAVLSERVSRRLSLIYGSEAGLSVAEWRVMVHLSRCHRVSVREIHNCVNLEKSRVSRAVSRLEAAGLVKKSECETDHRLLEISLSDAGWEALTQIIPRAQAFEARLMGNLSERDQTALTPVMEKLHQALDADPDAKPRSRLDIPGADRPQDAAE